MSMGMGPELAHRFIAHHLLPGTWGNGETCFRIIGLRRKATVQEVDRRKRTLSLKFSPDKMDNNLHQFCQDAHTEYTEDHMFRVYILSYTTL
jgi:hypothetical protein